jgi:hypothetical protein
MMWNKMVDSLCENKLHNSWLGVNLDIIPKARFQDPDTFYAGFVPFGK